MVNISCIEYTTAIICASLPHLKALASTIIPGYFDSAIRSLRSRRQSARYSRGANMLGKTKSTNASRTSTALTINTASGAPRGSRSHARRSMGPLSPSLVAGAGAALNLSGRSEAYRHDSMVESRSSGDAGAGAGAGAGGAGRRKKGDSSPWVADGGSGEYMLETLPNGEIWKKTEVEIQIGVAVTSWDRENESSLKSTWHV